MAENDQKLRHARKYYAVRAITYGIEAIIFAAMLWSGHRLVVAFVTCRLCSYLMDFVAQKSWTFRDFDRDLRALAKELAIYLLIRGGALLGGYFIWMYLREVYGMSEYIAFAIALVTFWTISFFFYRRLFIGAASNAHPFIKKLNTHFFKSRSP